MTEQPAQSKRIYLLYYDDHGGFALTAANHFQNKLKDQIEKRVSSMPDGEQQKAAMAVKQLFDDIRVEKVSTVLTLNQNILFAAVFRYEATPSIDAETKKDADKIAHLTENNSPWITIEPEKGLVSSVTSYLTGFFKQTGNGIEQWNAQHKTDPFPSSMMPDENTVRRVQMKLYTRVNSGYKNTEEVMLLDKNAQTVLDELFNQIVNLAHRKLQLGDKEWFTSKSFLRKALNFTTTAMRVGYDVMVNGAKGLTTKGSDLQNQVLDMAGSIKVHSIKTLLVHLTGGALRRARGGQVYALKAKYRNQLTRQHWHMIYHIAFHYNVRVEKVWDELMLYVNGHAKELIQLLNLITSQKKVPALLAKSLQEENKLMLDQGQATTVIKYTSLYDLQTMISSF